MIRLFIILFVSRAALANSGCTSRGGKCQNWKSYKCTAGYVTGLCRGNSDIRCCLPCNSNCLSTENKYDDSSCESAGGSCKDNSNYCSSSYSSGRCGGPSKRQCCGATSGGSANSGCTSKGGKCQNWKLYKCTAGYVTGQCSGSSDIRCCLPCNAACVSTENSYDDSTCESGGGSCKDNSNYCSSSYSSGRCGGPSKRQCCGDTISGGGGGGTVKSADIACTSKGGRCLNWKSFKCTAGYETGLCSGDSDNRCCLPCDATCLSKENSYDDSACESAEGSCKNNSNHCSGIYSSGRCGGPSERQCCAATVGGASGCSLVSYSNLYIKGYNGLNIRLEQGFVSSMDVLTFYAKECGVTVWVTHAFRREGQTLSGTVVPPASFSNHLVGHGIDFNLGTSSGWCNGDCLSGRKNGKADCFIKKVLGNKALRWGEHFSPADPVHIDDGLNLRNRKEWEKLYYQLQGSC